jgi:hypothetical protein
MNIARVFSEPIIIIFSWMVLIIGILGAAHLIGAKLPADGALAGPGDLLRNA